MEDDDMIAPGAGSTAPLTAEQIAERAAEQAKWEAQEAQERDRQVRAAALGGALQMAAIKCDASKVLSDAEAILAFLKA